MSWKYFTEDELKCSHTGRCEMDDEFMWMVDQLREAYGKPLRVTSAFRDSSHPVEARKAKPGTHTFGRAIDLAVHGANAYEVIRIAQTIGFTGIGAAQKGPIATRFIHLDNLREDDGFPRPWVWSY